MITAHGTSYPTAAAAEARIAELNTINLQVGASDGRVTEIQCIMGALQDAGAEMTPAQCTRFEVQEGIRPLRRTTAAPTLTGLALQYVLEAESDLKAIARTGYDDGRWRYMKWVSPEGRMSRREYRTQKGFLTAYIREAHRGSDILIAE